VGDAELAAARVAWSTVPAEADGWTAVQRRQWKKKHTISKFKRHAKRHPEGAKPKKKRAKTAAREAKKRQQYTPLYPDFWNETCKSVSGAIWMPVDLVDNKTGETAPSWFDTRTYANTRSKGLYDRNQAEAATQAVYTVCQLIKDKKDSTTSGSKSKVFFFKPSKEQRGLLERFLGGARYCHNRLVEAFNRMPEEERMEVDQKTLIREAQLGEGGEQVETDEVTSKGKPKKKLVKSVGPSPWESHARDAGQMGLPYVVRKNCARNLLDKRKAWKQKRKNEVWLAAQEGQSKKKLEPLVFKQRDSKKCAQESFYVEQYQLNQTGTGKSKEGLMNLQPIVGTTGDRSAFTGRSGKSHLPRVFGSDCRLVYNRVHDHWKLVTSVPLEQRACSNTRDARRDRPRHSNLCDLLRPGQAKGGRVGQERRPCQGSSERDRADRLAVPQD
jgi:hypothetical protein